MADCISPGWGTGPYGQSPWGGSLDAVPGGPLPVQLPFDIYCVGPCGPMSVITTFDDVDEIGAPDQFAVDPVTLDQILQSGGAFTDTDVQLIITTSVPEVFTLDFTVQFGALPPDFSDIVDSHIFIGLTDAAGPCVGLFFSQSGIAYVGGVHHNSGDLVIDSSFQQLPNSQLLVSQNEYWTIRIAANNTTGGVYIYITKTAELAVSGHQLRYVLPVIPAEALAFTPTDRTLLSVRGTLGNPSSLSLDSICLGSGFIIPNIPPVADAGLDQAARTCSIIQLDGSASFDPEGAIITYKWRLIDAPLGSKFIFDGVDGQTFDTMSNFTNKFYSPSLEDYDNANPILAGDVLLVDGQPYTLTGKGTDGSGFYVTTDGFVLPDDLLLQAFKFLPQNGISGPTTVKPTFYPDIAGFYKFDLIVFDGGLFSSSSTVVVNVTESPVPRGCYPDLRFIWGYLSNFWNLLDDKERITLFWGAAAQVAATELLTLWQTDYSKSLRDVQRTFQRRWLHYDPPLIEPLPDLAATRAIIQGVRSVELSILVATSDYANAVLTVSSPALVSPATYTFPGGALAAEAIHAQIEANLKAADDRFRVDYLEKRPADSTAVVRIYAPFPFTITQSGGVSAFLVDTDNAAPAGTGGLAIGVRTYRVDRSLTGLGIVEGDILMLEGDGYRIVKVVSDPADDWEDQRIVVSDDLPTVGASSWSVPGRVTSIQLDFYAALVTDVDKVTFVAVNLETGDELEVDLPVAGTTASLPRELSVDVTPLSHYLFDTDYSIELRRVRRYGRLPIDDLVVDIPYLQERVLNKDDTQVLRRNLDFYIEEFRGSNCIRFVQEVWDAPPPDLIWAETTYLDNRPVIEQNFGIPVEFTLDNLSQLPNNVDYLSAVRGLWYSYFHGPTLFNLQAGTQILLGLPFAEETGIIEEIRDDFSSTQGRILVRDAVSTEIVRSYSFPASLDMEVNPVTNAPYAVGDTVQQFSPLVTGTEVLDRVKDPKWFEGYLHQGNFYELEKFHKFLIRVDSAAFNLAALLFVKSFVLKIKPTYTYPLFVVLSRIGDTEVSVTDSVEYKGRLTLFDLGVTTESYGMSTMFDEPDPSGGGWQSQFDANLDPTSPALSYPQAQFTDWGYDQSYFAPEDFILATAEQVEAAPFVPTSDSIFGLGVPVYSPLFATFEDSWVMNLPAAGRVLFDSPFTVATAGTITEVIVDIVGYNDANYDTPLNIIITKNGVDQAPLPIDTVSMTWAGGTFTDNLAVALAVGVGDTLSVRIVPGDSAFRVVWWKHISIRLGAQVITDFVTPMPAGTYQVSVTL